MTAPTRPPAPSRAEELQRHAADRGAGSASWRALGTTVHLLTLDPTSLEPARNAVVEVLADVDLAASRFRPDSELSAVNAAAGQGWREVSPLLLRMLRVALDTAAWSGGLVDPTVGRSLLDLGYDRTYRLVPADGPALHVTVRAATGWQQVELDEAAGCVRLPAGTVLDLGATGKGLAADLAAQAAERAVGGAVLVNLGGDLRAVGPAPRPWQVLVTDDSDLALPAGAVGQVVPLGSGGLATSSTTARRWRRGGSDMHHLVDPASGLPTASRWRTVSVTASTCLLANAASTAALLCDGLAASWLAERGLAARLVDLHGTVTAVGSWPAPAPGPAPDPAGS